MITFLCSPDLRYKGYLYWNFSQGNSNKIHTLTSIYILHKVNNLQKELTDSKIQFGSFGKEIKIIKSNHMTEVGECRRARDGLDQRLSKLEGVCSHLDSFSDSIERITEGLNRHVSGLWSSVNGLNDTVAFQGNIIDNIQDVQLENVHSNMSRLNSSLIDLVKEFHSFMEQDFKGESRARGAWDLTFE